MRIIKGLLLVAVVVGVVIYVIRTSTKTEIDFEQVARRIDESVPIDVKEFELQDDNGKLIRVSDFKGKPILLNFWATWCPPCEEELPSLLGLAEWGRTKLGLVTIAVSVDESWVPIRKMFTQKKLWPRRELPLTILLNSDAGVAGAYGTVKYPETFFIDRDFKVVRKFVGPQNWTSREIIGWLTEHSK